MSLVLVVDDMPIFREPIAACLRGSGHETLVAGDGQQALALVQKRRPDLILLDIAMPVMDGLAFLAILRADAATKGIPVLLLTAASDKEHIVRAAKLGVQEYMLKSQFSLRHLLERVKKHLPEVVVSTSAGGAPASAAAMTGESGTVEAAPRREAAGGGLTRAQCLERIENAGKARSLTSVVAQVIALANSPHSAMSDLAVMISRDPILATRVLQVANSAAYSTSHGVVSTIEDAVRRIGCSSVGNIAVAAGVLDAVPAGAMEGFDPIRSLGHSLAVAALCERLVPGASEKERAVAYLMGICHDLGEILFQSAFAGEYRRVRQEAGATDKDAGDLERRLLGATRAEIERLMVEHLGLPEVISRPILALHRPGAGDSKVPYLALLRMADGYANGLTLAAQKSAVVGPISTGEARAATGLEHPERLDAGKFRAEILTLTGVLGRHGSGGETQWMAPLFPRKAHHLLLVRSAAYSSFDPVQAALESMAKVTVAETILPELARFAGMVIVAPGDTQRGLTASDIHEARMAGRVKPLPVLWLTGREHTMPGADAGELRLRFPVGLQEVAGFISGLDGVEARPSGRVLLDMHG